MRGVKWQLAEAKGALTLRAWNYHNFDVNMDDDSEADSEEEDESDGDVGGETNSEQEDNGDGQVDGGDHGGSHINGGTTPSLYATTTSVAKGQDGVALSNEHNTLVSSGHADVAAAEHATSDANTDDTASSEPHNDTASSVSDFDADDAASVDSYDSYDPDRPLKLPPTVIFKASLFPRPHSPTDWTYTYSLLPHGILAGPERLVINITYAWTAQLFSTIVGNVTLPDSLKEIVFHFKKVGPERPRYMLCQDVHDDESNHGHQCVQALSLGDPVPTLEADQHLDLVHQILPRGGTDLFQHIANLCAKRVASGNLKVTLVGVDEFDAARDADAAGDDAFQAVIGQLPWDHPVHPRKAYAHPPYQPVADTLVDRFLKVVGQCKRSHVTRVVKIQSREEYLAQLNKQRRTEEDWWACEVLEPCQPRAPSEDLSGDE